MRKLLIALLLTLLPLSASAQTGWLGSLNGQDIYYGTVARPATDGADFGTADFQWTIYADAITSTGAVLLADGSGAAPSLAFASDPDTGFNYGGSGLWDFSNNGTEYLRLSNVIQFRSDGRLEWSSGGVGNTSDVVLSRGAANRGDWASGDSMRMVDGTVQIFRPGIATTSTTGLQLSNTTAATAGATLQYSPRIYTEGRAWDTDDTTSREVVWYLEILPVSGATVSSTLRWATVDPVSAAVTYPVTVTSAGGLTTLASITSGSFLRATTNIEAAATGSIYWASRGVMRSGADGKFTLSNQAETTQFIIDASTDDSVSFRNAADSAYADINGATPATAACDAATAITINFTNGIFTGCS